MKCVISLVDLFCIFGVPSFYNFQKLIQNKTKMELYRNHNDSYKSLYQKWLDHLKTIKINQF